jgi:hypothetical protein
VRLDCDKGRLEARLALAAAGGLESLRLAPSGDETCVP